MKEADVGKKNLLFARIADKERSAWSFLQTRRRKLEVQVFLPFSVQPPSPRKLPVVLIWLESSFLFLDDRHSIPASAYYAFEGSFSCLQFPPRRRSSSTKRLQVRFTSRERRCIHILVCLLSPKEPNHCSPSRREITWVSGLVFEVHCVLFSPSLLSSSLAVTLNPLRVFIRD